MSSHMAVTGASKQARCAWKNTRGCSASASAATSPAGRPPRASPMSQASQTASPASSIVGRRHARMGSLMSCHLSCSQCLLTPKSVFISTGCSWLYEKPRSISAFEKDSTPGSSRRSTHAAICSAA
ncbi:MAG: hypothetical protein R3F60_17150 [bacterium]